MTELAQCAGTTVSSTSAGGPHSRPPAGPFGLPRMNVVDGALLAGLGLLPIATVRSPLFPFVTARFSLVVVLLPLGTAMLVKLMLARDRAAAWALAFVGSAVLSAVLGVNALQSLKGGAGSITSVAIYLA